MVRGIFPVTLCTKVGHEEAHRLLLTLHIAVGMLSTVLRIDELCVNSRWVGIADKRGPLWCLPTSETPTSLSRQRRQYVRLGYSIEYLRQSLP